MHPKYFVARDPHTGRDYLKMGMIINHMDLIVGYEKDRVGGWRTRDDEKKTILYSKNESSRKRA